MLTMRDLQFFPLLGKPLFDDVLELLVDDLLFRWDCTMGLLVLPGWNTEPGELMLELLRASNELARSSSNDLNKLDE